MARINTSTLTGMGSSTIVSSMIMLVSSSATALLGILEASSVSSCLLTEICFDIRAILFIRTQVGEGFYMNCKDGGEGSEPKGSKPTFKSCYLEEQ